ncbi:uncharacterized protein LOC129585470 [Paramacrobiotus metropolitanus]|uniref:uncharacterized protein LOC129585470 n=1 Tax=Paramacrobiotus metropolitanus TaxID=2943436 RepID=UPI002446132F|nr:uncharacterized protein LOC129585470 [Paramacrobiotus metropolitanus]
MEPGCCLPGLDSEYLTPSQDSSWENFQTVLAVPQRIERGGTQRRLQGPIFCAVCQQFLEEPCWFHAKSIPNESVVPFALASLPDILYLDVCTNSCTGKKVLAKGSIPPQTIFGPLVAATAEIRKESTVYAFPSPEDGQLRFFQLDSELFSNWMRYVRFAENPAEENLAVYLRGSQVVFVSLRAIFPGEELKVGYSAKYARTIGRTNRLSETQDSEGFYVAGVETVERNASALPQNLPKRTCAAVDTADWDFDSLETSLPGSTENVLLPTAPPISANTVLSDPSPAIASSTKLDAVLTTVRPSLCSDAINRNSDGKKTAITHWVVTEDLPVRREVQQRVPGQLKRKRGRPQKSDTVNKDDCRQQVKRELDVKSDTFEYYNQETVKRKRGRPRKQPIVDQGGNLALAAQNPKDLTVSPVKATSLPTSRASDAGGNAVLPASSKSIDVAAVQGNATREDSPEIDYHPAVWKTESPNKEQLVSTEFHSRRSTLRSAVKEGVLPVEKPAVPAQDDCDDGEEVVLTGKGMGVDSDSDWAAEDGLVSDHSDEDDDRESEEDICDMITERKPGQNRGKRTKNKTQYSSNQMLMINGNDSTTTTPDVSGSSSDLPTSANGAENSGAQRGAPVSRRKMEQKECCFVRSRSLGCRRIIKRLIQSTGR